MADYFLTDDLDALLKGGVAVKEKVAHVEVQPVEDAGELTTPQTPATDKFVEWFVTASKAWDESKQALHAKK